MTFRHRILRRLICDRRGHRITQLESPDPDPEPVLVLLCTRCKLEERHEMRRLNRAERREAARAA